MSVRELLGKPIRFEIRKAWNIEGKFYHSENTAIDALADALTSRVGLKAYYRRGGDGTRYTHKSNKPGYYQPGGWYERFYNRVHVRCTKYIKTGHWL